MSVIDRPFHPLAMSRPELEAAMHNVRIQNQNARRSGGRGGPRGPADRFLRAAGSGAGFRLPSADAYAGMYCGCGFGRPQALGAGKATVGRFAGGGPLPFLDPRTGGLDAGQLANAFASIGFDPTSAGLAGQLVAQRLTPQQFFQPLWSSMGGTGLANPQQLAGMFAPQAAPADLAAEVRNRLNAGNAVGLGNPVAGGAQLAPRDPTAAGRLARRPIQVGQPAAPVSPAQPGLTAGQIAANGQANTQGIMNRATTVARELFGRDAVINDNAQGGTKGKVDATDTIQYTDANGKKVNRALGDKDFRELQMRTHVVEGTQMLDQAQAQGRGLGFSPDMNNPRVNPAFWEVANGRVKVKAGVSPTKAIDDVFANPNQYSVDCAAAANLVGLRAIRQTVGAGDFDKSHAGLSLQGWDTQAAGGGTLSRVDGDPNRPGAAGPKPGDVGYIKNPQNISAEWQGENVIYLGNGQYWGHPGGTKTSDEWVQWLNTHARTPGATQSAFVSGLAGDFGAARWAVFDRDPTDSNAF